MKKSYYLLKDSEGINLCVFTHNGNINNTKKKIKGILESFLGCEKEDIIFRNEVVDYEPFTLPDMVGEDDSISLSFVWSINNDNEFTENYRIEKVVMY